MLPNHFCLPGIDIDVGLLVGVGLGPVVGVPHGAPKGLLGHVLALYHMGPRDLWALKTRRAHHPLRA